MITQGIAGRRNGKVKGVVIHNDAGSNAANGAFYKGYINNNNAANGFAHYYVASDGIVQIENEANMAWHTANPDGNANFIGIEACQSMGNLAQFLDNEKRALKLAAEILKRHGLQANTTTVRLHNTFSPTACPHRSQEQHGAGNATQAYFIAEIKKYMGGSTPPTKPQTHNQIVAASPAITVDGYTAKEDFFNTIAGNKLRGAGWMLPTRGGQAFNYGFVFIMDYNTGKELARQMSKGIARPDVTKAYNVKGGNAYGLDCTFDIKQFKGKKVYVMFRRTNDKSGNTQGGHKDISFKNIYMTL